MAFDPGPEFPWGIITRRSQYNRRLTADGEVELFEESTARQEGALVEHIQSHNMGRIVAVYTDIASAYDETAKRPGFEAALADLAAGRIGGIAAWRPDRLARRLNQLGRVLAAMEQSGGRLLCLSPIHIDTGDVEHAALTRIFLDFLVFLAEMESEGTGQRVALMHLDKARKGLPHLGGPHRAFGHTRDMQALVPEEVELLHELGERVLADEGLHALARDWTERAITTTQGGTRWHSNVMRRILLSPRMVGKREYGGELYELRDVPPIFDAETWERVCARLTTTRSNERLVEHLLSNIALCGKCSRTLLSNRSGRKSTLVYACRPHFENDTSACGKLNVVAKYAEARVREEVVAFLADKERVRALLKHSTPDLNAVHARIAELSESLHALGKALNPPPGVPRMSLEAYYEQVTAIEAEREGLHRRLAVSRDAAVLAETLEFDDPAAEWDARSVQWRRTILRLVTGRIVVEPRGKASVTPGRNAFDPERVRVEFAS